MSKSADIEEAFVQLVVSHQASLRAFVLSLLPGSPEVDDVVQETNAAVWQKRGAFEIGTNFKAWMFSVARFKVMNVWRAQKRRKVWAVPEETLIKLIDEAEASAFEGTESRHAELRVCLEQLSPQDRGLVLRRYMKGKMVKDLAGEMGRSADSVKVSLYRIRAALKICVRRKLKLRGATI